MKLTALFIAVALAALSACEDPTPDAPPGSVPPTAASEAPATAGTAPEGASSAR